MIFVLEIHIEMKFLKTPKCH